MELPVYSSNSDAAREERSSLTIGQEKEQKEIEKVDLNGSVEQVDQKLPKKIFGLFFPEDIKEVKKYIFKEVIVPKIKSILDDSFHAFLYNQTAKENRRGVVADRVSYRNAWYEDPRDRHQDPRRDLAMNNYYDYQELRFTDRRDAEAVLDRMAETVSKYNVVSVADMYDIANIPTMNYQLQKYGWSGDSLKAAKIVPIKDGLYLLKMPKPYPLG